MCKLKTLFQNLKLFQNEKKKTKIKSYFKTIVISDKFIRFSTIKLTLKGHYINYIL